MAALLAADPRLGRILRPLCWMLGVHASLAPPPRKRRAPPTPEPSPDAPDAAFTAAPPPEIAPGTHADQPARARPVVPVAHGAVAVLALGARGKRASIMFR